MKAKTAVGTKMVAFLPVRQFPIVFSIHGERPSITGLAYHNIYITLSNLMQNNENGICKREWLTVAEFLIRSIAEG